MTRRALPARIRAKVRRSRTRSFEGSACWEWTGCLLESGSGSHLRPKAYGQVRWQGERWRVHRLVYTLLVGEIPEGFVVDHRCRFTRCCNPAHLEAVTQTENTRRAVRG